MAADKNGERAVDARVAQLQEITYAFSDALLDLSETIERQMQGIALMAEDLAAVALDLREMQAGDFDHAGIGERIAELGDVLDNLRQSDEELQRPAMQPSLTHSGDETADELLLSARQALSISFMNAVQQQQQLWTMAQAVLTQGVSLILDSVPAGTDKPTVRH